MLKFVYISVYDYEDSVKTTNTKYPMIEIEIDWTGCKAKTTAPMAICKTNSVANFMWIAIT